MEIRDLDLGRSELDHMRLRRKINQLHHEMYGHPHTASLRQMSIVELATEGHELIARLKVKGPNNDD